MSKSTIWSRLKAKGFSDIACAAIMGNMWQESVFKPNNVEDRYHRDTGKSDEYYTAAVDNGSYSRSDFMRDGGKAYGYGLCQWTFYSRKAGLYDFAKSRGVSIADEQMQIDWMWKEMHQSEYKDVLNMLMSNASLYEMTKTYMCIFENPADQSDGAINYRVGLAGTIYNEFAGTTPDIPDDQDDPVIPTERYWPPKRQICQGMSGGDVSVLKAILNALDLYSYDQGEDVDIFGQSLRDAVIKYQKQAFPNQSSEWDGIVGNKTWGKLLERG